MNMIERPNRNVLSDALDTFRDAMRPFIINALKRVKGKNVEDAIYDALSAYQADEFQRRLQVNGDKVEAAIDIGDFPNLVRRNWKREVFGERFTTDMTVQDKLRIIAQARNHVSHPDTSDLDPEYTRVALYHIVEVLGKINAPGAKGKVEKLRDEHFDPNATIGRADSTSTAEESAKTTTSSPKELKPWREVIPPNIELTQGTFEEAELAADLQQVYDGRASATSYGNPVSFFKQTYITEGIRLLLVNALRRLGGKGGAPVIQTKTGFGGGKTHSLIALYHLTNSIEGLVNLPDIYKVIQEAQWTAASGIQPKVAVLDGTYLSPTDREVTENGAPLNTLWGVMAYQLGGQQAYNLVGEAARRQDSAPLGAQLDRLFEYIGPCVILIDELVAYMLNVGDNALGANYTFIQALTESVRRAKSVVLVVTLPESQREAGGMKGEEILTTLAARMGRIESIWKPLETTEAFEVVRRRLFGNEIDKQERDKTCNAFLNMYNRNRKAFPQGVHEQRYLERMQVCYPLHPEIFERLHSDWSTIHEFQRTRGVLRMMANCISRLYRRGDTSPLILPANLPFDDPVFASEFDKLLSGRWDAVFTEADSDGGRADLIDQEHSRFSEYGGASRRIARTVFLGSCPSGAIRGIDATQIHLGVAQPGHRIPTYTEALNQMEGNLYYFYADNNRYYFHTEENLNKVAIDRANALSNRELNEHIVREINEAVREHRSKVISCPEELDTIPDSDELRLVLLHPEKSLPSRAAESDEATPAALHILTQRANAERIHRNTLLFLTAKADAIRDLKNYTREYLAWQSIMQGEHRIENLEGERYKQAQASLRKTGEAIRSTIPKAYRWAIAPAQLDPQRNEFSMFPEQAQVLEDGDIVKSAFDTFKERESVIEYEPPEALEARLKEYVWHTEDHISINHLWNMMTQYIYMPRLANKEVLLQAIKEGVQNGTLGYADSYDAEQKAYRGMCFAQPLPSPDMNGLLVKSEIAGRKPPLSLESLTPILRKNIWETGKAHIEVQTVWEMMPEHVDQSQLRKDTLIECIEQGVPQGQFGYATGITDEAKYENLFFREALAAGLASFDGLLVDPETVAAEEDEAKLGAKRIVARKIVEGELSLDDIDALRQEIIGPLDTDGGNITVEITITAYKADGFSQNIERSVRENGTQLNVEVKSYNE